MIGLWRYNKITGYWVLERQVDELTAEEWYRIFCADEPGEYFYLSRRKPKHSPIPKAI